MSPISGDAQKLVRSYFQTKQRQLIESASLAICDHPVLAGSHREELQRIYLREVLPKRFEVGRGMVYGFCYRSKEADIVIWDAQNFPSLAMSDHSFYFAESVRVVLESKSRWSSDQLNDVLDKMRAVKDIVPMSTPTLTDELAMIRLELASLREGKPHDGMLISKHHIGTAAIFMEGGESFHAHSLTEEMIDDAEDSWPDLMLLLRPGRFVVKEYSEDRTSGWLLFYDLGPDALLAFTSGLLSLIMERSVQTEQPFSLMQYAFEVSSVEPIASIAFPLRRFPVQQIPLWR